jgi:amino acid transporter
LGVIAVPAYGFLFIGLSLITFDRTELFFPILAAGVVSVMIGLVYGLLGVALPRSGGDYIFLSRILHPTVGAVVGGALLIFFCLSAAFGFLAFAQVSLPFFLNATASATHIDAFSEFASTVSTETGSFISGLVTLVAVTMIAALGSRAATRTIFYGALLSFIAVGTIIIYFLTTTRSGFINSFNGASGSDAYQGIKAAAGHSGLPSTTSFAAMLLSVPFILQAYVGFTFSVYPGGEIKRASTTMIRATVTAIAVAGGVLILMWISLRHLAGFDFLRSAEFLSTVKPGSYEHFTSVFPEGTELFLMISKDPVSKIVASGGIAAGAIVQGLACLFVASRLIFAMSFDRLLPTKAAYVSDRTHAPIVALAVSAVIAGVFVYLGTHGTILGDIFRNAVVLTAVVFLMTSIGATLFPFVRRDLYRSSPKAFGESWFGLPPVTVIGGIASIVMALLLYTIVSHDEISGGFTTVSTITLIVSFTIGLAFYFGSRLYSRTRGIDLSLAMTELPPE